MKILHKIWFFPLLITFLPSCLSINKQPEVNKPSYEPTYISEERVNVRKRNLKSSNTTLRLDAGDRVEIGPTENGYTEIFSHGIHLGYVYYKLLSSSPPKERIVKKDIKKRVSPKDSIRKWFSRDSIGGGWEVIRVNFTKKSVTVFVQIPYQTADHFMNQSSERQLQLTETIVCPSSREPVWNQINTFNDFTIEVGFDYKGRLQTFIDVSCRYDNPR